MNAAEKNHARTFRALHHAGPVLVLPNAWDCASARIVEAAGAAAIATSSAAVAWAHGAQDGEHLAPAKLVAAVEEIARVVRVPLTVDLESGYHAEPEQIADLVAALLDAGAVGFNLEDASAPPEVLAKKLAVARRVAERKGIELFLNARTDVYLHNLVPAERAVEETLVRARRYQEAGADGFFVPGIARREDIEAVSKGTPLPLNVLARSSLPPVAELGRWGVRRFSVGIALSTAAMALVRRASRELLEHGTCGALFHEAVPYPEMNALFDRK